MSNHISHAALPYPIRGARFSLIVGFSADGVPTDPTTPDSEFSVDGGASFSDCAEEITTGGSNGVGYLTLSGDETDNDALALAFKSANCVTERVSLSPRNLVVISSGTLSAGSAGGGTLGTIIPYDITGCFIKTTGGTGGGGTGGANNQARKIMTYNTSFGSFTVSPNWETTPNSTTTYEILLGEGHSLAMLKTLNPSIAGEKLSVSSGVAEANVHSINTDTDAAVGLGAFWKAQEIGTAQAGASTTITLASSASSVDDYYNDQAILITAGTAIGLVRRITDYDGTTKVATVSAAWNTTPDTSSVYMILGRIE